tara:strand:- start:432 stop:782 length:351 start_codon:yes stop_codon:yes gene_type:complete
MGARISKSRRNRDTWYDADSLHGIGQHLDTMSTKLMVSQTAAMLSEVDPEDGLQLAGTILSAARPQGGKEVMINAAMIIPKGQQDAIEVADPDMQKILMDGGGTFVSEVQVVRKVR